MKFFVMALALGFALALALPAAAQVLPFNPPVLPPGVSLPTEDGAELRVVEVGPNMVRIWGSCPIPTGTYFITAVPKRGDALGRALYVKFDFEAHRGSYKINGLTPGTDYTLRVWGKIGRTQLPLGRVEFTTLRLENDGKPLPPPPVK
jgi:hypothetical protein